MEYIFHGRSKRYIKTGNISSIRLRSHCACWRVGTRLFSRPHDVIWLEKTACSKNMSFVGILARVAMRFSPLIVQTCLCSTHVSFSITMFAERNKFLQMEFGIMEAHFADTMRFHSIMLFSRHSQQLQCKAAGGNHKTFGDWGPIGICKSLQFVSIICYGQPCHCNCKCQRLFCAYRSGNCCLKRARRTNPIPKQDFKSNTIARFQSISKGRLPPNTFKPELYQYQGLGIATVKGAHSQGRVYLFITASAKFMAEAW